MDDDEESGEEWLATYADTITLLMTFFVLLLSTANFDPQKLQEVAQGLSNGLNNQASDRLPFEDLEEKVTNMVSFYNLDKHVSPSIDSSGLTIELNSNTLFESGSARLRRQVKPILKLLAKNIGEVSYQDVVMTVEGHSDDSPIHTRDFPSNWELSARRAINVVRFFGSHGLQENRLKAVAFAHTRPKVPNRDAQGKVIKKNQSINRRIVLFVYRDTDIFKLLNPPSNIGVEEGTNTDLAKKLVPSEKVERAKKPKTTEDRAALRKRIKERIEKRRLQRLKAKQDANN